MAIIVQADIEAQFGTSNVRIWSNLENDSRTANATRIEYAIAYAEDYVNNRFRAGSCRYAVPLVPASGSHSTQVKNWCAVIAGHFLYDSRRQMRESDTPDFPMRALDRVESQMDAVIAGTRAIDYVRKERAGGLPVIAP
mgnify:CR=1 FL=1